MRKILFLGLAILVLVFLSLPAWAQGRGQGRGGGRGTGRGAAAQTRASAHPSTSQHPSRSARASERSNRGGEVRGRERAAQVQEMNRQADANRGFTVAPGLERREGERTARGRSGQRRGSQHARPGRGRR